jgi:hypothetical protein
MVSKNDETRTGLAPRRASEIDLLGWPILSEDNPDRAARQARWVASRFRLTPHQARLIAELAFGRRVA